MGVVADRQGLAQAAHCAGRHSHGEVQDQADAEPQRQQCQWQVPRAGTPHRVWVTMKSRVGLAAAAGASILRRLWHSYQSARAQDERSRNVPTFQEAAELARAEWLRASAYFDEVVDPDLIDYAAYSLRAAERKYVYLLKRIRQESASSMH